MPIDNKAAVRRLFDEYLNGRKSDKVEDYVTRDWTNHDPGLPNDLHGYEGAKQLLQILTGGFPDMKAKIEDIFAEGDKVAVRFSFTGTHKGEFMGAAPTGKKVDVIATGIFRVHDGKVAENWVVFDAMGVAKQIGLIPEMERAGHR